MEVTLSGIYSEVIFEHMEKASPQIFVTESGIS
jgi:hypothetical protein